MSSGSSRWIGCASGLRAAAAAASCAGWRMEGGVLFRSAFLTCQTRRRRLHLPLPPPPAAADSRNRQEILRDGETRPSSRAPAVWLGEAAARPEARREAAGRHSSRPRTGRPRASRTSGGEERLRRRLTSRTGRSAPLPGGPSASAGVRNGHSARARLVGGGASRLSPGPRSRGPLRDVTRRGGGGAYGGQLFGPTPSGLGPRRRSVRAIERSLEPLVRAVGQVWVGGVGERNDDRSRLVERPRHV